MKNENKKENKNKLSLLLLSLIVLFIDQLQDLWVVTFKVSLNIIIALSVD